MKVTLTTRCGCSKQMDMPESIGACVVVALHRPITNYVEPADTLSYPTTELRRFNLEERLFNECGTVVAAHYREAA